MTTRTHTLEAGLATIPDLTYVAGRTVVALPPSDADPLWDEMRVAVSGTLISRAFDPGEDIVTGAPIGYVTKSGEPYVTKSGVPYVTKVSM